MTGLLAERARQVAAIELDRALAERLKEKFGAESGIEIYQGDILSTDLAAICERFNADRCYVFGNVPYYITSPIVAHLRSFRNLMRAMALLVQWEVANRIVAAPGSRDYGYLSAFVQMFSRPRVLFAVPRSAFSPPPKVHSGLVEFQIEPRLPELDTEDTDQLLNFIKQCFARKRKNLINNLSRMAPRKRLEQELDRLDLPPSIRAEQMTIEQFAGLFERLR